MASPTDELQQTIDRIKNRITDLKGYADSFPTSGIGQPNSRVYLGGQVPELGVMIDDNVLVVENSEDLANTKMAGSSHWSDSVVRDWTRNWTPQDGNTSDNGAEILTDAYRSNIDLTNGSVLESNTGVVNGLVGIHSPYKISPVGLTIRAGSTSSGDGAVGFYLGTPADRIVVTRTTGGGTSVGTGPDKLLNIKYNPGTSNEVDLGSTNEGLLWGDGVVDPNRSVSPGTYPGWDSAYNGTPARVDFRVRGSAETSQVDLSIGDFDTPGGISVTKTIDFTQTPAPWVFEDRCEFGFIHDRLAGAFWEPLSVANDEILSPVVSIVDIANKLHHTRVAEGFPWDSPTSYTGRPPGVKVGRFYYNPFTTKLFYMHQDRGLIRIKAT